MTGKHRFWYLVHNVIAHPLLGFCPNGPMANYFHDWTYEKTVSS